MWLRIGPVVGPCEHGNEPSGSKKKEGNSLTSRVIVSFSGRTILHGISQSVSQSVSQLVS
jgi:hypothetical protein